MYYLLVMLQLHQASYIVSICFVTRKPCTLSKEQSCFLFYQDNLTVSEGCANGQDIRASYELSYNTVSGTPITTCVVNGTECRSGTCRHDLQNNTADSRCQPTVSQFSGEDVTVSVTARNIVGRSNPAIPRNISEFLIVARLVGACNILMVQHKLHGRVLLCLWIANNHGVQQYAICRDGPEKKWQPH